MALVQGPAAGAEPARVWLDPSRPRPWWCSVHGRFTVASCEHQRAACELLLLEALKHGTRDDRRHQSGAA